MAKPVIQPYLSDKTPLVCFRNPYLLILKTSLRATCSNRANLGKTSLNPAVTEVHPTLFSPWGWGVWEQLPLQGLFIYHDAMGTLAHLCHASPVPCTGQSHQGGSAPAPGLELHRAINQPQGFLLNKEIFPLPKISTG